RIGSEMRPQTHQPQLSRRRFPICLGRRLTTGRCGEEAKMTTTDGIEALFLETHNWGKTTKFFQALGYELEFSTEDGSGILRNGDGPYIAVTEVPENETPGVQIALTVANADAFRPAAPLDVVTPFEATHYGTKEMVVRDPDGRLWSLQAPAKEE